MSRFLQELRRRRVFGAAGVYAVVGWAVIQFADVIFPALEMPDWSLKLVVLIVLLGFPIALVLSWAFDLTPQGLRRADAQPAEAAPRAPRREDRILRATGVVVLLVLVGFAGFTRFSGGAARPADLRSIAVLPFVNMSGNAENEYFSDGLSEELLNVLVKVPGLSVAARTSSFAYKGKTENIRGIARDLKVATVLEGSVRRAGDRVRITAQLIRADNGYHLWSETYDRQLDDIFAIQEEIAHAIANVLKLTLGADQPRLVAGKTADVAAYDLYLKGRYALGIARSESALRQAVSLFEQAIARDSSYGLAYAGLADAYVALEDYVPAKEVAPLARAAAMRAIALDDSRAETHTALGHVSMHYDFDWDATARAYRRAVALAPASPEARGSLAHLLFASGRYEEGLAEIRRAIELGRSAATDTIAFQVEAGAQLAHNLNYARDFDQAIVEARRVLEIDPQRTRTRRDLIIALLARGQAGDAQAALELAGQLAVRRGELMGYALAKLGREQEARVQLTELLQHRAAGHVSDQDLAVLYLGLGDAQKAIDALDQAYRRRDPEVLHVRLNPLLDPLWKQPRFLELMKKAGVPLN